MSSAAEVPPPPAGFAIGHWTAEGARTGCTVVLPPTASRAGVDVRGGGPGTRETEIIAPLSNPEEATAVLFTGGSAHGLAAADGVMRWCEEHGRGYRTPGGLVPLVPAAVIYDLTAGAATVRPDAGSGYAACEAAGEGEPFGSAPVALPTRAANRHQAARLSGALSQKMHLHARYLRIRRPSGGYLEISAKLPPHMQKSWSVFGWDADDATDFFPDA